MIQTDLIQCFRYSNEQESAPRWNPATFHALTHAGTCISVEFRFEWEKKGKSKQKNRKRKKNKEKNKTELAIIML